MAQRLSGIWFKLVEPDGFHLGILMVPPGVAGNIETHGRCRCPQRADWMPAWAWTIGAGGMTAPMGVTVSFIDFVPADHLMRDAIMVFGISLSGLNKEPGFAFIPSAEYMFRGLAQPAKVKGKDVQNQAVASRFSVLDFADDK